MRNIIQIPQESLAIFGTRGVLCADVPVKPIDSSSRSALSRLSPMRDGVH